jgi:Tfp pilus assembly protein PilO
MMRFIMPIVLIGIAVAVFFMFANPIYNDISALQAQVASYNDALNNSKTLENQRDILTTKYNAIDPDNLAKLQKFLPDNVDNIRLILEIGQIASPYGMTLTDVKYNADTNTTNTTNAATTAVVQGGGNTAKTASKDYGTFDLEFSTSGTYSNFINFTKDLESNLRMVDISSITLSSDTANTSAGSKTTSPGVYKYDFKIKTYWLKN